MKQVKRAIRALRELRGKQGRPVTLEQMVKQVVPAIRDKPVKPATLVRLGLMVQRAIPALPAHKVRMALREALDRQETPETPEIPEIPATPDQSAQRATAVLRVPPATLARLGTQVRPAPTDRRATLAIQETPGKPARLVWATPEQLETPEIRAIQVRPAIPAIPDRLE